MYYLILSILNIPVPPSQNYPVAPLVIIIFRLYLSLNFTSHPPCPSVVLKCNASIWLVDLICFNCLDYLNSSIAEKIYLSLSFQLLSKTLKAKKCRLQGGPYSLPDRKRIIGQFCNLKLGKVTLVLKLLFAMYLLIIYIVLWSKIHIKLSMYNILCNMSAYSSGKKILLLTHFFKIQFKSVMVHNS